MGSYVLIGMRKWVVIWSRVCYRSVCDHPFLVGLLCWLYVLYRSFPVMFSLVVSASPVLITTALLLGTLLSYGELDLVEFERKVSWRSGEGLESDVDVGDGDAGKLRNARDLENEDSDDEKESGRDEVEEDSDGKFEDGDDKIPLILRKNGDRADVRWSEVDDGKEWSRPRGEESRHVEDKEAGCVPYGEYERLESEDNHSVGEGVDGTCSLNTVYPSLSLSPKREGAEDNEGSDSHHGSEISSDEDDEDEDEDLSESESDGNETSSPDASMADVMPMLDELHPLLNADAPRPAHSDVKSTAYRSVDASSIESAEDSESQDDDDGDDVDDHGEDAHGNEGEGDESGIKWTEDDQKNLIDMGTSELERNLRLENLIARRWARKLSRLVEEKNLIDLESNDLPFNVPHISTLRRNPFDSPVDSHDMTGLPPIPGSAPSILQPRRNPFDLPYDQNEEKPILTGGNFAQEFIPPQRDAFFRRHESFSVGPSTLGSSTQEMRWRPYFVPERTAAEEAYASIQRELNDLSQSKVSSVPETESASSASDHEDQKDIFQETNMVSIDEHEHDSDHEENESKSSEDAVWADVEHVNRAVSHNEFEIQLGDQGSTQETEADVALNDDSSSHVEYSHSEINMCVSALDEVSEGSSHLSPTPTNELHAENDEIGMEMEHTLDDFQEAGRSQMHLPVDEQVENGSDSSSVTSLSENNEEISDPIRETGDLAEESHSVIHSPNGNLAVEIPDNHHIKEPVYDSSPHPMEKHLLFLSENTDFQPESSVVHSPVAADESETEYVKKGFEEHEEREIVTVGSNEDMHKNSSHSSIDNENQENEDKNDPTYKSTQHEQVQIHDEDVGTSAGQTSMHETERTSTHADATTPTAGDGQFHLQAGQVSETDGGSSSDSDTSEDNHVSKEGMFRAVNESSLIVHVSDVGPNASSDSESLENHKDARTLQFDHDESPIPSSNDDARNHEQVSVEPINHAELKGESSLDLDQKHTISDSPTAESSSNNHRETTDSFTIEAESTNKTNGDEMALRIVPDVSVEIPIKNRLVESIKGMSSGVVLQDELDEFQTPVSARYFDFASEKFQPNATGIAEVEEELEDYKEMDQGLLAELDAIGDFSVPSSEEIHFKSSIAAHQEYNRSRSLRLNHISDTIMDVPVFEGSSIDHSDLGFHQIDDGIPVEEVILPSLLFGSRSAFDSKNVHVSEPHSPISETREVSPENEELVSPTTEALEETKVERTNTSSSVNTEMQKEDINIQEHAPIDRPKHMPDETAAKDQTKEEKTQESSSDSSSCDSDSD